MYFTLIFLTIIYSVNGYDYIQESFNNYVDHNTPPCDNFYRHACKLGSPKGAMETAFESLAQSILAENPKSWDRFRIWKEMQDAQVNKKAGIITQISNLYFELCENGGDKDMFLDKLRTIVANDPTQCYGDSCYQYIAEDPDCKRGEDHIKFLLVAKTLLGKYFESKLEKFFGNLKNVYKLVQDITVHLDGDVRDGIEQTKTFLEDMKVIAEEWIQDTPWAINHNVTNSTSSVLSPIAIEDNFGSLLLRSIDILNTSELSFRDCMSDFQDTDSAIGLCLVTTMTTNSIFNNDPWFSITDGFIVNPLITLGYAFYHVAQNSEDMSAKLGFTGAAVGHELSHILIKSRPDDFLTYFSYEAMQCIQFQYNSTCATFIENSCDITSGQFDDNGADILGMQLSYKLLEDYYGDTLNETIEAFGVTNQQLYFYALAFSFCDGEPGKSTGETGLYQHAPRYTRVNAMISQNPGFKEAFQCSDDRKMIKSAVKQCIVYGKKAPQAKKTLMRLYISLFHLNGPDIL